MFGDLGDVGDIGVVNAGMYRARLGALSELGDVVCADAECTTTIDTGSTNPPPVNTSGSSLNLASVINPITQAALAASQIYRTTQTPSVVPGSQLVWNPATGQFVPASGVGITGLFGTGATLTGSSGLGIMLAIGAVVVVVALASKR